MTRPTSLYPAELRRAVPRGTRPPEPLPQVGAVHGEALASLLGLVPQGVFVTERSAGGLPALDFGVTLIASAVSQMLAAAEAYSAAGDEEPAPTIVARPHPLFLPSEFWSMAVRSLLMRGNFVAIYGDYDVAGWPRQLVPVDSSAVTCDISSGLPVYRIGGDVFVYGEVFHVRRDAPIGTCWGMGVVEKFRKALSGQLHEQAFGESSYASGGVPSAVITLDAQNVTKEVAEAYQNRWLERHASGQRKPAVVPKSISITPLSWSPEDQDYVAARQLSVADAAFMLGLSPSDLEASVGGGGALTYSNLTDRNLARIVQSYAPVMALFEEALSDALPGGQKVRGNVEALLRSTTRERYELHALAQKIGLETTTETRAIENRPPLTEASETTGGENSPTVENSTVEEVA